jgi:hypothetical protein
MLDSINPLPFIETAIVPVHLPESASQILAVVSFVDISAGPSEDSVSMLFILEILSFVFITVASTFLPHSVALSQAIAKSSLKITSIGPVVLSIAIGLSAGVLAFIEISISKFLSALALFQARLEVPFIAIAIDPNMNSVPFCFSHSPLSDIAVSLHSPPHPRAVL